MQDKVLIDPMLSEDAGVATITLERPSGLDSAGKQALLNLIGPLIPAIKRLPGLISYFAAVSPTGALVHVSVWDSDAHAQ
jgi:hypothetical protein